MTGLILDYTSFSNAIAIDSSGFFISLFSPTLNPSKEWNWNTEYLKWLQNTSVSFPSKLTYILFSSKK
jgi:hypothetical protein